jgi:galactofuranose transport system substrate-binding protein
LVKHTGFTAASIIDSHNCNFDRPTAKTYLTTYLAAHTSVKAIYSHNDNMALGAIEAITAAGKTPGTDIIVVSIDGVKEGLQAVFDGKLYYSYECNPLHGPMVADLCQKLIAGTSVAKTVRPTERGYLKADLTQAFIDARTY